MTIALNPTHLADAVRTGITGDQLVYVADSSNIEARMLAWLAGQENLLEIFRTGGDVYSNFASILFGRPIDKNKDPLERFIGKVCVLGLGYGMGWKKFRDTLAAGALGGEPVYFTEIEAQNAVNTYRAANSLITAYWEQANNAIVDMYLGNVRQWGPLTIHRNCLVMPNGMALQYPGLRPAEKEDEKGNTYTDGWEYWNGKFWTKIYGGKLVENITQAMSRIVLFSQMLKANREVFVPVGGRVVLNVHDEIIGVGPSYGAIYLGKEGKKELWHNADKAEALFQKVVDIMRTPEPWCPDLPLDSEGGFAFEYSK
jgi:DNA polymerase